MVYMFRLGSRNYRADMTVLTAGHFAGLGVGIVPKLSAGFAQARPEMPYSATSRRIFKPGASFSQGVRLILRSVTVTFSTPQTRRN
jgi:hypothetical protein